MKCLVLIFKLNYKNNNKNIIMKYMINYQHVQIIVILGKIKRGYC